MTPATATKPRKTAALVSRSIDAEIESYRRRYASLPKCNQCGAKYDNVGRDRPWGYWPGICPCCETTRVFILMGGIVKRFGRRHGIKLISTLAGAK